MPLLLKGWLCVSYQIDNNGTLYFLCLDTTFISEGNETYIDGLVNFEKMVTTSLLYTILYVAFN